MRAEAVPTDRGYLQVEPQLKPPAKVQLGPYSYDVVYNRAAFDRIQVEERTSLCGRQKLTDQKIHINPEMGPDATADTLIHECLHHFFRTSALPDMDTEDEERIVNFLGTAVLAMFRDNPELVEFVCGNG